MEDSKMNEEEKKELVQDEQESQKRCPDMNSNKIDGISRFEVASLSDVQGQVGQKQKVMEDLYGHKSGFVPVRRDLYENLLRSENTRAARRSMFEDVDDLSDKITVPTDSMLNSIDISELFVKIEMRAVLKIRILFAKWAQNLVHNSLAYVNAGGEPTADS